MVHVHLIWNQRCHLKVCSILTKLSHPSVLCVGSSPSVSTRGAIRGFKNSHYTRNHRLRYEHSCCICISPLHPIRSFIARLCHHFSFGFVTSILPSSSLFLPVPVTSVIRPFDHPVVFFRTSIVLFLPPFLLFPHPVLFLPFTVLFLLSFLLFPHHPSSFISSSSSILPSASSVPYVSPKLCWALIISS